MDTRTGMQRELAEIALLAEHLLRHSGIEGGTPIPDGILYFEIDFIRLMASEGALADTGATARSMYQVRDKIHSVLVYARNIGSSKEFMSALSRIKELAAEDVGAEPGTDGHAPTPSI